MGVKKQNQKEYKMKMFKKIMAVALAAVMMLAMMTACQSVDPEENVLNALNQARTENYGKNALVRDSEADMYAQDLAGVIAQYYNDQITQDALSQKLYEMNSTFVQGYPYNELYITSEASSVKAFDMVDQRITKAEGHFAGIASFTAKGYSYTIVISY